MHIMLLNMAQPPEKVDEAAFQTCEAENSMMMAWLVNTMDPEIGKTCSFLSTTKEMWDAVNEIFSNLGNSAQGLWQELDQYHEAEWENARDVAQFKRKTLGKKEKRLKYGMIIIIKPDIPGKHAGNSWKPAKNNHFLERNNHAFQAKNSQSSNLRGAETQPFTKEQLELLHRFINQSQNNPTPNPFSSLAQKGNFFFALSVSSKAKAP
ncbi:hypothetical protein CK203_040707 [Vitis vinifera]|uniref:Retrotransposon Copia-like N-terminal domain-containing protein n=1 Tax=Vitis vinifera TaxID=29760 RepID=A0A438HIR1_VITVI|nr:hypothetical protein CK203_040707 [Vitis vinifera]